MQDRAKRPRRDEAAFVRSSEEAGQPVPEAANRSPTSILPAKAAVCPRLSRDLPRRIFISDDRARRGMQDEPASPSSSRDNTPRKPGSIVTRSRDLPRRVLLPDDGVPSKKRPAPVQAPVTPARRRKRNTEDSPRNLQALAAAPLETSRPEVAEALSRLEPVLGAAADAADAAAAAEQGSMLVETAAIEGLGRGEPVPATAAAAIHSEVIVSVEATISAAGPFVPPTPASPEYFRGVVESTIASEEQQIEVLAALVADSTVCSPNSSPRTPPRSPVSTLPATPKAPVKRERPTAERLPRAGAHSIRRLDFGV